MSSKGTVAAVAAVSFGLGAAAGYLGAQHLAKSEGPAAPAATATPPASAASRAAPDVPKTRGVPKSGSGSGSAAPPAAAPPESQTRRHWARSLSPDTDKDKEEEKKEEEKKVEPETTTPAERAVAWAEIRQLLPRNKTKEEKKRRLELFKKFDKDGSGALTLDEVYTACVNELHLNKFTSRLRGIVKRAYNKAKGLGGAEGKGDDGEVEFLEFRLMLCYIYDYFELTTMFDTIDTDGNGLLDRAELRAALPLVHKWGLKVDDADAVFDSIDDNKSGQITFDEFAAWATEQKLDMDGDPDNVH